MAIHSCDDAVVTHCWLFNHRLPFLKICISSCLFVQFLYCFKCKFSFPSALNKSILNNLNSFPMVPISQKWYLIFLLTIKTQCIVSWQKDRSPQTTTGTEFPDIKDWIPAPYVWTSSPIGTCAVFLGSRGWTRSMSHKAQIQFSFIPQKSFVSYLFRVSCLGKGWEKRRGVEDRSATLFWPLWVQTFIQPKLTSTYKI